MPAPSVSLSPEQQLLLQAQLLNAVNQAVVATDVQGHVVFWNRFAETLYGWSAEDVQGCMLGDFLIAPAATEQSIQIFESLQRGEPWSGEFPVRRRDGTVFPVYVSDSPIYDDQGTLLGIVGISHDITEQKRMQEAQRLLAEAGLLLIGSDDREKPLSALAELAVPELADWCAVHLLQPDGSMQQVAIPAAEQTERKSAFAWLQHQLSTDEIGGVAGVLRSGLPKLVEDAGTEHDADVKSYMIVPLMAPERTLGTITFMAGESGRRFDPNALEVAKQLAGHVSIYLDKAEQYRESELAKQELERSVLERTAQLQAATAQLEQAEATVQTLLRITRKLNVSLDVDTILDDLAQEAIVLVHGDSGFAGLRTAEGLTIHKMFSGGQALPCEYTWEPGAGVPGWVLENKIPYGTSEAATDPRILHHLDINSDVRNLICTPILDSAGEVLGFFDIRNKTGGDRFTIADQDMLMALAPIASVAIQNALAYRQRTTAVIRLTKSSGELEALAASLDAAREQERTEIAQELHDQLGQSLTAMKFDLAWLSERLVKKDGSIPFGEKIKVLRGQMDSMIKTVRQLATELRPGMLDDLGLPASIEWQAHDFEKRTGIPCRVTIIADNVPLARNQSLAVFRIYQEALTNVARHAQAKCVDVKLTVTAEVVRLWVHDDGRGIRTGELSTSRSLGLIGMRERAQRLGGSFNIHAVQGGGTMLSVSLPVTQGE